MSESQPGSYHTTEANNIKAEQDFGLPKDTAVSVASPVSDKNENVLPAVAAAILEQSEDTDLEFEGWLVGCQRRTDEPSAFSVAVRGQQRGIQRARSGQRGHIFLYMFNAATGKSRRLSTDS
jgi:hypothetical protein